MEDYPRNLTELEARFSSEAACREYLFRLPVARWVSVPALRRRKGLAATFGAPGMRELRVSNVGHGGDDLPGHAQATGVVVSHDVVGDQPEERSQRLGSAARPWAGKLQDRLDVAAQVEAGHGPCRT